LDAVVIPLRAGSSLPLADGALDSRPIRFLLDTGAPICNLDPNWPGVAMPPGGVERHRAARRS